MRKNNIIKIFSLILSFFLFAVLCVSVNTKVHADDTITYEEADKVSIGDIAFKKTLPLLSNTEYYYEKKAERGSIIFSFDLENNKWTDDTTDFQVYFVIGNDHWNAANYFWFKNDMTVLGKYNPTDGKSNSVIGGISADNHSIEVGRLAILKNGEYTNQYYVYTKVDGEIIDSNINEYDYRNFTNSIFITGNTDNVNQLIDPNYIESSYEDADVISVSDWLKNGKSIGNKVIANTNQTYSYNKTKPYGSVIVKFDYKVNTLNGDSGSSQFSFGTTWNMAGGIVWFRNDNCILGYEDSAGKMHYEFAPALQPGNTYEIEFGRLAVMRGSTYTNTEYLYLKVNGELNAEINIPSFPNTELNNNNLFFTGNSNNVFTDKNWTGNKITFMANKAVYDEYLSTADYITKPAVDPSLEGKRFVGWFDAIGNQWNFESDQVTGDLVLTAAFVEDGGYDVDDETYFADDSFTPVLRFLVSSDTHISQSSSSRDDLLKREFEVAYGYAKDSATYNNLDAALFAGDLSDDGSPKALENWKRIVDESIKKQTALVVSMGNHEFRTFDSPTHEIKTFEDILGDCDSHVIINGYHFIALSPNANEGYNFTETKQRWLEEQLAIASEDTPNKPIFVIQHEGIYGTVYGSISWGMTELTDILCKYPQVVDFSGHSHYPLTDPRSIWQGTFTALGTGTLHYYELGINGYKDCAVFPTDKNGGWASSSSSAASHAEFQIVELDANNAMRVIIYDLTNEREITRYYMRDLLEDRKFTYSHTERAKDAQKPYFEEGTTLQAQVEENTLTLSFDQAKCDDIVESYRIELYKGNKLVQVEYALSDYFFYPMPEKIKYSISYLEENTEYTIKVYAVNVWNMQSDEPITATAKTENVKIYEDVVDEISLRDLYGVSDNKPLTTDTLSSYKPVYFIPSENNNYGSFKLTLQLLYIDKDFQICFDEEFENDDLIWFNNDGTTWFIKDNFHGDPISKGLHVMEYGRYHITEGAHMGYTAFYVKVDDKLVYTCESEKSFTSNGHFALNFNSCYAAGSRYYDMKDNVPVTQTPEFVDGYTYELNPPAKEWAELGGVLTFDSLSPSLEFWLEDKTGALTGKKVFDGKFTLGDNGNYYKYEIKTNKFKVNTGITGKEDAYKICCSDSKFKWANVEWTYYEKEILDYYDEVDVLDINYMTEIPGVYRNIDTEKGYDYVGYSDNYSALLRYYLVTEDLSGDCEFRTQLGTLWSYFCTLWLQPGNPNTAFFGFQYTTRPSDRTAVNIKPHSVYEIETATIRVKSGEWAGYNYTYLKINGEKLIAFYVPANECASSSYQVAFKMSGGYVMADLSLGRTIEYIVDGKTYKKVLAVSGTHTYAPENPSKEGYYFNGWYTQPEGGERVNYNNLFISNDPTVKYYARFTDKLFDVNFYSEGELFENQKVGEEGLALIPSKTPTKTGDYKYQFVKWVIKGTDEEFDFSNPIMHSYDVEAVFTEYEYKIAYLVDGLVYVNRYYVESNPSEIIGLEPEVPTLKGATGYWVYSDERTAKDIYVSARYDGVETTASDEISLDKFNGAEVDIADDLTRYYLSFADTEQQASWIDDYAVSGGHERQNITFSWNDSSSNTGYLAYFADNPEFKNAFIVKTETKSLDNVGIFVPGKTYYWKVLGLSNNKCSAVDTFTILNTPVRWFSANTVYNTRDNGGWITTDGKMIKYEMLYRGGQLRLDQSGEASYMDDYSYKVFNYLGIKTEIELRGELRNSPHPAQFNELANCIMVNGIGYEQFFNANEGHKADYRAVFKALADESNYPFYYHCSWGADRTGSLGFLIGAVLGLPYETLVQDYELTSLSYSGRRTRYGYSNGTFNKMYLRFMEEYSNGGTINDAVYNYLVNYIGVKPSEIEAFRNIMLVDASSTLESHIVTYKIDGEIYQQSKVFEGGFAKEIAPVYFDKHLKYWTLDGKPFDINTPITDDIELEAVFEETHYEDYDLITIRDVGLGEWWTPVEGEPHPYIGTSPTGSKIIEFDYEIVEPDPSIKNSKYTTFENGVFDDGVHIELGSLLWSYKSQVWIAGSSAQHMFTKGDTPVNSLTYNFEYGKTYNIKVGVVYPLDGMYAGKKMLIFMVNDEIVCQVETSVDLTSGYYVCFAGSEGILRSVENKKEVVFYNVDGSIIQADYITRGEKAIAITSPTLEDKVFLGWFDELGNQWNFNSDLVLKDVKLYARFGEKTIGALLLDENDYEITNNYQVKVGEKVSDIEVPSVNNKDLVFDGWYNGDAKLNDNDVITEDMDLICRFNVVKKDNPDNPDQPDNPDEPDNPENKGCKGVASIGFGFMSLLTMFGAMILKKKRN